MVRRLDLNSFAQYAVSLGGDWTYPILLFPFLKYLIYHLLTYTSLKKAAVGHNDLTWPYTLQTVIHGGYLFMQSRWSPSALRHVNPYVTALDVGNRTESRDKPSIQMTGVS
jgi:hypothetical protein